MNAALSLLSSLPEDFIIIVFCSIKSLYYHLQLSLYNTDDDDDMVLRSSREQKSQTLVFLS